MDLIWPATKPARSCHTQERLTTLLDGQTKCPRIVLIAGASSLTTPIGDTRHTTCSVLLGAALRCRQERMRLEASCELTFESHDENTPVVLMLRTQSSESQRVVHDALSITPTLQTRQYRDMLGNSCDGLVAPAGELVVRSEIVANVDPHVMVDVAARRTPFARLPAEALHYTLASRYCPADKLQQLAGEVTRGCQTGYPEVQAICDYVRGHLKYQYGVSDGSTDALDTLQERAGVCRDFAHVAIALCRSIDIPARMVAGYLHGREPMDMHAWFEAHLGDRWYTFDPSEPQLRGGRIVLAHGRDAADIAFVTSYGNLTLRSMAVSVREQLCTAIGSGRRSAAVRDVADAPRPALLRMVEPPRQRRA